MKHFPRAIRVAFRIRNGGVSGVLTLLGQNASELHFWFRLYRTPELEEGEPLRMTRIEPRLIARPRY